MTFKPHLYRNARNDRFAVSVGAGRRTAEIDASEAARILGVSDRRVRQLIKLGELSARRVGKFWVLSRDEVASYESMSSRRSSAKKRSVVYFVERDGFVKIGTTANLPDRLRDLGRGSSTIEGMSVGPVTLLATLPGDHLVEKRLHLRFERLRVGGEWFLPDQELNDFIANVSESSADSAAA